MAMSPPQLSSTSTEDAVSTLLQSVEAVISEIDGGCKFSDDVLQSLSKCKADLDKAVDRFTPTGQSEGEEIHGLLEFEAKPMTWKVSNKLLISTPFVRFLERRGKQEAVTLFSVFLTTITYFAIKPASLGTKVSTEYTNDGGETIVAEFIRPRPVIYVAFILCFASALFLTTHGLNRRLLWAVSANFEGLALFGSQIGATLVEFWNFHQTLGDDFDNVWRVLIAFHFVLRIWLAIIITGIDALKFGRKIRIAGQLCVTSAYLFQVVQMRCASKEYPEEFMVCSPTLMTFREMGSALMLQSVIFLAKNIAGKMEGSTFGNIHPVWVSSKAGDVMTVSRTLSDLGTKMKKRVSVRISKASRTSLDRSDADEKAISLELDDSKASTGTPSDSSEQSSSDGHEKPVDAQTEELDMCESQVTEV